MSMSASTATATATANEPKGPSFDRLREWLHGRVVSDPLRRKKLLKWYRANRRDLPWRRTRDPYAIWVSEIMCQQTRVDTVIPYYRRFLERFPTPEALAEAEEDDVMSLWSGLGYYRRARLLRAGVKEVVARYGGEVPRDKKERLSLPGVGPYTAGAIGSIAFDQEEAVVDGNVARVLSRVHRLDAPLGSTASGKALWQHAESIVAGSSPGDLNQAVMELGATICTPTSPKCSTCPIRSHCGAHQAGEVELFPVPKKRKAPVPQWWVAVVPTVRDRVWLHRPDSSLFGGLWSLPLIESVSPQLSLDGGPEKQPPATVVARRAMTRLGIRARVPERAGEAEHVLSHRRLHVQVWRAKAARAEPHETLRDFDAPELKKVGIATLTKKLLRVAGYLK